MSQAHWLGEKILFCGLSEAGKTAIRSLVFSGKQTQEVEGLSATINYVRQLVHLDSHNLDSDRTFTILDLGGQKIFLERFINQFSTFVFNRVRALIYVVDSADSSRLDSAKAYLDSALARLKQHSPSAKTVVLLHKTDLLQNVHDKRKIINRLRNVFQRGIESPIIFFETSIYDNSLKDAFDEILRISFPEMVPIPPVERGGLVSPERESIPMEPTTPIKRPTTDPSLPSEAKIRSEIGLPTEETYDTFTAVEQLIEYLEALVISLELSYGALLEANGTPLVEIGDSHRYLEIVRESYEAFQLKSIKTSESVDPWVVETGDMLIVAQPIKASRTLLLVCVTSIKNQLLEKMPELRIKMTELVHKALGDPS
ncbi:MAG: ADP-ribosylation factor-like protein [Candidatus Heimdallarchaeota archaeon]